MNQLDFTFPNGFKFHQGILEFLQSSIFSAASGAAAYAGNLAILSGCEVAGSNVSAGVVVIGGEIMPFEAGAIDAKVIIVETVIDLPYEDGTVQPAKKMRVARFGDDGITNYQWTDFKRNKSEGVLARLDRLEKVAAPFTIAGKGGMVLWNRPANEIPDGWAEVVDWRGRLPMGYDPAQTEFNLVGKTGGAKGVKMMLANLIAHVHNVAVGFVNGRSDNANDRDVAVPGANNKNTTSAGSADPEPINVLNPYRVVVFIEYVGG
ncbi:hypothetical protein [Nubsella zeaxanthinifaciens]|uniref:hypothetical protein n=1 Tax=Nubsella zeaxanthinifaciens TaxID=392412 RepID=UPI000DE30DD4|nr:hypothetical protein [Nubsella zeaxanthinifaciens]